METSIVLGVGAVLLCILAWFYRERFTDPETPVSRPSMNSPIWRSKIDAFAPLGTDESGYISSLALFYDGVYLPAQVKPTTDDIEKFLLTVPVIPGVEKDVLRKIIFSAFHIEYSETAAAREEKQTNFKPSAAIQPKDGVDEVYVRTEETYRPTDTQIGELPEGTYAPVHQQATPRYEAISASLSKPSFSSVP